MDLPKLSTAKPKFKYSKDTKDYKNHLDQNFNPKEPNTKWASDITYIKVANKFAYLCVIMDLFSRKVIAWKLSDKIDTKLVIDTFLLAYNKRNKPKNLLFHSDRGSQYTSSEFRKLLDSFDILQSFSKKGYPFDNAVVESFFKHMKREEINRKSFNDINDLKLCVFEYIDSFYNLKRPHGSLDYMTPNEKELKFYTDK